MRQKFQFRLRKLLLWTTVVAVSLEIVSGLGIDPALVGGRVNRTTGILPVSSNRRLEAYATTSINNPGWLRRGPRCKILPISLTARAHP